MSNETTQESPAKKEEVVMKEIGRLSFNQKSKADVQRRMKEQQDQGNFVFFVHGQKFYEGELRDNIGTVAGIYNPNVKRLFIGISYTNKKHDNYIKSVGNMIALARAEKATNLYKNISPAVVINEPRNTTSALVDISDFKSALNTFRIFSKKYIYNERVERLLSKNINSESKNK